MYVQFIGFPGYMEVRCTSEGLLVGDHLKRQEMIMTYTSSFITEYYTTPLKKLAGKIII